jgi:4-hydroxythreonine-4-phosphate dehydrogenase
VQDARGLHGVMDVLDLKNMPLDRLRYKQVTPEQGRASFEYVTKVIELAMERKIDGTVTGPINKAAINAAGHRYAGHTEIYAALTGTRDYTMMLAHGNFRVTHVSTHVSLREACDRVKKDRIMRVIDLTWDALHTFGIARPRVGVAGLNPHCGEGGMFGHEDDEEILPAVESARRKGYDVEGPIPADTVFSKMKGGMYDAVVVMYHDQGHIPMKFHGFQYDEKSSQWAAMSGVNITLGLPIVRTSVDHGTAFDKAGEGRANPQSMIEAIQMGAMLSRRMAKKE